ncbi:MAG: GntR family transcriptional regulator [Thermomicrobiales bacterium]|nr:GntR family transcriptional regulator [Thermomicrobiales bacterium]
MYRAHRGPLYRLVAADMRKAIVSGRYPAGSQLPTEAEMSATYGVSRVTYRQALQALEDEGLITRQQGVGSFVSRHVPDMSINQLDLFEAEVLLSGFVPSGREISITAMTLTGKLAESLECAEGTPGSRLEEILYGSGDPVIYSRDFVALPPKEGSDQKQDLSVRQYLSANYGIDVAQAALSLAADLASAEIAPILDVEVGAPLIRSEGIYYDKARKPIIYGVGYFRTDRYHITVIRR